MLVSSIRKHWTLSISYPHDSSVLQLEMPSSDKCLVSKRFWISSGLEATAAIEAMSQQLPSAWCGRPDVGCNPHWGNKHICWTQGNLLNLISWYTWKYSKVHHLCKKTLFGQSIVFSPVVSLSNLESQSKSLVPYGGGKSWGWKHVEQTSDFFDKKVGKFWACHPKIICCHWDIKSGNKKCMKIVQEY